MAIKPILFNTEMIQAILGGSKCVTRRVVKDRSKRTPLSMNRPNLYKMITELNGRPYFGAGFYGDADVFTVDGKTHIDALYFRSIYQPGDILYVRETWCERLGDISKRGKYIYKAHAQEQDELHQWALGLNNWRPSIHMPKEVARLFLRVTGVRVERLQEIDDGSVVSEGLEIGDLFDELWNRTIKKADRPLYGWDANPWVWVITFERVAKPEGWCE